MTVEAKPPLPSWDEIVSQESGEAYARAELKALKALGWVDWFREEWKRESSKDPEKAYPSQGLAPTPYDKPLIKRSKVEELDFDEFFLKSIVPPMLNFLEIFNHPDRIKNLPLTPPYSPPKEAYSPVFARAELDGRALAITQIGFSAQGHERPRSRRVENFKKGPFVMLGRYPRIHLCGSANPECWGSAPSIAHMAESHALTALPRDGVFVSVDRQAALARKVFEWFDHSPVLIGRSDEDREYLLNLWKHNVMGVLEVNQKGLPRAEKLYEAGIRTFRLYSPEPGSDLVRMTHELRAIERTHNWEPIEIFSGQVVHVEQARELEAAGADGIYIGIGGGGRCITGLRGGIVIDWPQLVWKLRGHFKLPIIVEGGASDNIAQTLIVGATGIGVTRAVAGGSVESPGGLRYYRNGKGEKFKLYGGEASARVKYAGGKVGPFGSIPYVEGEITRALMNFRTGEHPTLLDKLNHLNGNVIMAMVYQNAGSFEELQQIGVNTLKESNEQERYMRSSHETL